MQLDKKVVAITGGARGLGFAIAKRLGKQPMHLLLMWQTSNRFSMPSLISPSAWGLSVAV